jgi:hypothetical protein
MVRCSAASIATCREVAECDPTPEVLTENGIYRLDTEWQKASFRTTNNGNGNPIITVIVVGLTTLCLSCKPASHGARLSGTPVAATRECARKRRDAVQDALR